MARNRSLWSTLALLVALAVTALPAVAAKPDSIIVPGTTTFPEGIAFQQSSKLVFVGSTTTGAIYRGTIDDPELSLFLPGGQDGRTDARGLEVDAEGRLWIAGGTSDRVFAYDAASGALRAALALDSGFINDQTVTGDGDAYFTDSFVPVIYRVYEDAGGAYHVEDWLDLPADVIEFGPGFNLNGIVATPGDRYLVTVQSNTGKLFRIDRQSREVIEIDLDGASLTGGDGLVLQGHTLYVVRNFLNQVAVVRLSGDASAGAVVETIADASLDFPTTAARGSGRLLVLNSQLDERGSGADGPFTVSLLAP